jgi:V/A-type H+-transporting ATPase subunit F
MSTTNEYKIAIIGPTDTVSGFKALGVEALEATTGAGALEHLREIKRLATDPEAKVKYAVVCVIEDLMKDIDQAEYTKAVAGPLPAVVLLPGATGSQGFAIGRLRQLAEQAVGASII